MRRGSWLEIWSVSPTAGWASLKRTRGLALQAQARAASCTADGQAARRKQTSKHTGGPAHRAACPRPRPRWGLRTQGRPCRPGQEGACVGCLRWVGAHAVDAELKQEHRSPLALLRAYARPPHAPRHAHSGTRYAPAFPPVQPAHHAPAHPNFDARHSAQRRGIPPTCPARTPGRPPRPPAAAAPPASPQTPPRGCAPSRGCGTQRARQQEQGRRCEWGRLTVGSGFRAHGRGQAGTRASRRPPAGRREGAEARAAPPRRSLTRRRGQTLGPERPASPRAAQGRVAWEDGAYKYGHLPGCRRGCGRAPPPTTRWRRGPTRVHPVLAGIAGSLRSLNCDWRGEREALLGAGGADRAPSEMLPAQAAHLGCKSFQATKAARRDAQDRGWQRRQRGRQGIGNGPSALQATHRERSQGNRHTHRSQCSH